MESAVIFESLICMLDRVLLESLLDRRCTVFICNIHDHTNPREQCIGVGRVRWTHQASAGRSPTLLDWRCGWDTLPLYCCLHFCHIVNVCTGWGPYCSSWEAILQDPLHATTLEAQNFGTVCYSFAPH